MDAFNTSHFRATTPSLPARPEPAVSPAEALLAGAMILGTCGGAAASLLWVAPLVNADLAGPVGITGAAVGTVLSSVLAIWFGAGRRSPE